MNNRLLKLVTAVCVLALLASGLSIFFGNFHIGLYYENAGQYAAGGAELDGTVKNLDIHWTDGAVNVLYHSEDTVQIAETAPKAISDDAALRWWLDGDTLRIQYAKSGFHSFRGLDKTLTLTLPEGIVLGDVAVDVTSGDVSLPDLRFDTADIDLTSGDLVFSQVGAASRVSLDSTSGDMRATLTDVEALVIRGTSGSIDVALDSAKEADVSTTSGSIRLSGGSAEKAGVGNTSGAIHVSLTAFSDLKIESTSGGITAALPSEPGFDAAISTTSGSFDSAIALEREGNHYACGDRSARLQIHTTSGNIRLEEAGDR